MRTLRVIGSGLVLGLGLALWAPAQPVESTNSPAEALAGVLTRLDQLVSVPEADASRTFTTTIKVLRADGLPKELTGREVEVAWQAPDHLRLSGRWEDQDAILARDGQEVWVYLPGKKFGLIGSPDVAPFITAPERKESALLGPIKFPLSPEQLALLPLLVDLEVLPPEDVGASHCRVLKITPKPEAARSLKLPSARLQLWVRESDSFPLRIACWTANGTQFEIELANPRFSDPWPARRWKLEPSIGDHIETVARMHLTRFLSVAVEMLGEKIPTLGPATGERRVIARAGDGRLETIDGTRVLILKGTPEEMGRQHGILLKKEIHELVDHILYGVGVGSSFEKGRWFFGEIEAAQERLNPFMNGRYFREMDALASASGLPREEVRLANFFPELFHCSGFAVFGKATTDGRLYHGRVLDYLRGLGLELNATVIVLQPEQGNAWVNVGYAGLVGSVTAMNEKHLAIGEMGGRGQGQWDGKPMAELVREVMEQASTLEEAVEIMRRGPRTCEYYYVISDAKTKRAVGIAATPNTFETIWPGQSHPRLPHPVEDTVLMSAGDRYEELARRVKAGFGQIDADGARDLMKRPVCMPSNIHCALFAPDTLDFWVANADSANPAAHTRYTHYNLAELLAPEKAP